MAKSGFGIELQELRTVGLVFAAAIPAVTMLARAKSTHQRLISAALGSTMLAGIFLLNVKLLRRG